MTYQGMTYQGMTYQGMTYQGMTFNFRIAAEWECLEDLSVSHPFKSFLLLLSHSRASGNPEPQPRCPIPIRRTATFAGMTYKGSWILLGWRS